MPNVLYVAQLPLLVLNVQLDISYLEIHVDLHVQADNGVKHQQKHANYAQVLVKLALVQLQLVSLV